MLRAMGTGSAAISCPARVRASARRGFQGGSYPRTSQRRFRPMATARGRSAAIIRPNCGRRSNSPATARGPLECQLLNLPYQPREVVEAISGAFLVPGGGFIPELLIHAHVALNAHPSKSILCPQDDTDHVSVLVRIDRRPVRGRRVPEVCLQRPHGRKCGSPARVRESLLLAICCFLLRLRIGSRVKRS